MGMCPGWCQIFMSGLTIIEVALVGVFNRVNRMGLHIFGILSPLGIPSRGLITVLV